MRNSNSTIVPLVVLGLLVFMGVALVKSWTTSAPRTRPPTAIPYNEAHSPSEFLRLDEARLSCNNGKASIYGSVRVVGTMNSIKDVRAWVKLYDKEGTLIASGSDEVNASRSYGKLRESVNKVGYSFAVEDMDDPNCLGSEYKIRFTGKWD
jgi:hypothetical protein